MTPSFIEIMAALLFGLAILHTFATGFFERLAHSRPDHAGLWHLLAEVEVVFGFWAFVLMAVMFAALGKDQAVAYLESRNFTEPMFVFAIMVVAGTRPILHLAMALIRGLAGILPVAPNIGFYFVTLGLAPLLGSFITEPAAMTLAALILRDRYLSRGLSERLKYATLGVLFVNISIGGVLTPYAAPPVLMVAGPWGWDMGFMMAHFGHQAIAAVLFNALALTFLFRRELAGLPVVAATAEFHAPPVLAALHLAFLAGLVVFAHYPAVFMGLFLLFLGLAQAYARYQGRLILREGLLVAFFLAGLVVLGGLQAWWLRPVLMAMSDSAVFYGAAALTALTDNAALTYLGAQVQGLHDGFKQALVAGAVTGGGLTIIANAPNPAGIAILRGHFRDEVVKPLGLLAAALPPTVIAALAFRLL